MMFCRMGQEKVLERAGNGDEALTMAILTTSPTPIFFFHIQFRVASAKTDTGSVASQDLVIVIEKLCDWIRRPISPSDLVIS